uniref:Protein phosphatase 1 regulatory subunit 12B-like n=1 Tax=Seriola dumerili TaxID=41447 RepID=A0A3B4VBD3_SERDU
MSSYYPRTKDLTRTRKSLTDSPPSSPSPTDKNYRHERLSRYDSSGESATDKPLGRTSSYTRRETRLAALNRQEQDSTTKDYKKMYAEALHENERLKSRLQDSKQELVKIRSQLEKVTQRHDRISERSTVLESEKREKQALEKRVSDMEEELKVSPWKTKLCRLSLGLNGIYFVSYTSYASLIFIIFFIPKTITLTVLECTHLQLSPSHSC